MPALVAGLRTHLRRDDDLVRLVDRRLRRCSTAGTFSVEVLPMIRLSGSVKLLCALGSGSP